MDITRRHIAIMKRLCWRRCDTIGKLAKEFNVSQATIRRDVELLSLTEPIYTQQGRDGGVCIVEEYCSNGVYVSTEEIAVLNKILNIFETDERAVLSQYELNIFRGVVEDYSQHYKKKLNYVL